MLITGTVLYARATTNTAHSPGGGWGEGRRGEEAKSSRENGDGRRRRRRRRRCYFSQTKRRDGRRRTMATISYTRARCVVDQAPRRSIRSCLHIDAKVANILSIRTTGRQVDRLTSCGLLRRSLAHGSVRTQLSLMPPSLRQASTIKVAECCEGFIPVLSSCAAFLETNLTKKVKKNEKTNTIKNENRVRN